MMLWREPNQVTNAEELVVLTREEWDDIQQHERPQAPQEVIERAREARHTYLQAKPGSPERRQAGRELAAVSSDLLAAVEAAPGIWAQCAECGFEYRPRPNDEVGCPSCKLAAVEAAPEPPERPGTSTCGVLSAPFSVSSTDYPTEPHECDARTPLPPEVLEALMMDLQQIETATEMIEAQVTGCGSLVALILTPRPRVFRDGDQWCALHGENIQEGIAGFGDTPARAAEAYWHEYRTSDAAKLAALDRTQGGSIE